MLTKPGITISLFVYSSMQAGAIMDNISRKLKDDLIWNRVAKYTRDCISIATTDLAAATMRERAEVARLKSSSTLKMRPEGSKSDHKIKDDVTLHAK
jgi:hypothetical protein